jgi:putative ABC transport system permease protein
VNGAAAGAPQPTRLRSLVPDIIRMAIASLRAHGMRSLLTTLGVVIGVATVVAMASVIQGFNRTVQTSISAFGSHVIYIRTFKPAIYAGGFPDSLRHRQAFTAEDAQAIRDFCPDVKQVTVIGFVEDATISFADHSSRGLQLIGSDPEIQDVLRYDPKYGRFFTREEARRSAQVIVIGKDVREGLFPSGGDPLGKTVHLNGQPFVIVGELEPKGRSLFGNPDELITIPFQTMEKLFPPPDDAPFYVPKRGRCYLNAVPVSPERMPAAIDEIRELLRTRRHVPQNRADDFAVMTEDSITDIYRQLTGATFVVMLLISSIALVVGGIGVMNIMLVAVTERTREIGVRRALGAPRASVLLQFLLEAAMLSGIGGLIGIVVGTLIGQIVRVLSPLPAYTPMWSVVIAFGFSVAVGLFFGFYPAMRASRLDPVEALRFE